MVINTSLSLNAQARAVLAALETLELPDTATPYEIHTFAFYNGREAGIGIAYEPNLLGDKHYIVITEHRNSDDLVLYTWTGPGAINPPTVADFTKETYQNGKFFDYMRVDLALKEVERLITGWAKEYTSNKWYCSYCNKRVTQEATNKLECPHCHTRGSDGWATCGRPLKLDK